MHICMWYYAVYICWWPHWDEKLYWKCLLFLCIYCFCVWMHGYFLICMLQATVVHLVLKSMRTCYCVNHCTTCTCTCTFVHLFVSIGDSDNCKFIQTKIQMYLILRYHTVCISNHCDISGLCKINLPKKTK